jgi:hypothetical protein
VAVSHVRPKAILVVLQRLGNHSVCKGRIRDTEVIDHRQGPKPNRLNITGASHEAVVKAGTAHDVALERHVERHVLIRAMGGLSAWCQGTDGSNLAPDVVNAGVEGERNAVLMGLASLDTVSDSMRTTATG